MSIDTQGLELQVLGVVTPEVDIVTKEQLLQAFPEKSKTITDELVNVINQAQLDPQFDVLTLFSQMISYKDVMTNSGGSMSDFINAIKFCSYLESCNDNFTQAYIKTFSYRSAVKSRMFEATNTAKYKELTSMASQYRRQPMVISILTISDAPIKLLTRGLQYKALQVLASEMDTAFHSKDRSFAADKLLTHTRALDDKGSKGIEINIGVGAEVQKQHTNVMSKLHDIAVQQKALLDSGSTIGQVQRLNLKNQDDEEFIDGEYDEN